MQGDQLVVELGAQTLGLTVCQVPVVVGVSEGGPSVQIDFTDGRSILQQALSLDRDVSAMLFGRTGEVQLIRATFPTTEASE